MNRAKLKKLINYLILIVSVLMLITGYGITKYQIVSKLSFGFLQKSNAFLIHSKLATLFIILLILHVALSWKIFKK